MPTLAVVALAGVGTGWFMHPDQAKTFDYVYAVIHPALFAGMCITALLQDVKQARWLVALLVVVLLLDIAKGPQIPMLSALTLAAGALAMVSTFRSNRRVAIGATAVCCASLAAALLGRLLLR